MHTPSMAYCTKCLALRNAYVQAKMERDHLQELEAQAVLSDRPFTLEAELKLANRRERGAKTELVAHGRRCELPEGNPVPTAYAASGA